MHFPNWQLHFKLNSEWHEATGQNIVINPVCILFPPCAKDFNLALFIFLEGNTFFYFIYYHGFLIVVLKILKQFSEDEEEIAVSKLVTTSCRFIGKLLLQRSFNPSQHWVRSCSDKANQDFLIDIAHGFPVKHQIF